MPCFTKEGTGAQNSEITNPRAPGTLCSQDSRPSGPQNPVEPLFLVQVEMYIPAVRISKTSTGVFWISVCVSRAFHTRTFYISPALSPPCGTVEEETARLGPWFPGG